MLNDEDMFSLCFSTIDAIQGGGGESLKEGYKGESGRLFEVMPDVDIYTLHPRCHLIDPPTFSIVGAL